MDYRSLPNSLLLTAMSLYLCADVYLQRGELGGALADWLEAERQLRSEQRVNRDTNAHLGRRGSE